MEFIEFWANVTCVASRASPKLIDQSLGIIISRSNIVSDTTLERKTKPNMEQIWNSKISISKSNSDHKMLAANIPNDYFLLENTSAMKIHPLTTHSTCRVNIWARFCILENITFQVKFWSKNDIYNQLEYVFLIENVSNHHHWSLDNPQYAGKDLLSSVFYFRKSRNFKSNSDQNLDLKHRFWTRRIARSPWTKL